MKRTLLNGMVGAAVLIILVSQIPISIGYQKIETTTEFESISLAGYQRDLPHWLNGTILDGTTRVVVTEDGQSPDDMEPEDYDIVISFHEEQQIAHNARQRYIEEYGVDPYSCEPGYYFPPADPELLPKDIDSEITQDEITHECVDGENHHENVVFLSDNMIQIDYIVENEAIQIGRSNGPHQINGKIVCKIVHATGRFRPVIPPLLTIMTQTGHNHFDDFGVTTKEKAYYGYWNTNDVPWDATLSDLMNDLIEDCEGSIRVKDNQVVMGWVSTAGSTYFGLGGGYYGIAKETCPFPLWAVAQHEISHCYGAPDHYWSPWPPCIMSYVWLFLGYPTYCDSCFDTINDNIWS